MKSTDLDILYISSTVFHRLYSGQVGIFEHKDWYIVWVYSHYISLADRLYLHKNSYHILYYNGVIISRWPKPQWLVQQTNCPHSYLIFFWNVGKNHKGQYSWLLNLCKTTHETIINLFLVYHIVDMSIMKPNCICSLRICPLMMSLWHGNLLWGSINSLQLLFTLIAFLARFHFSTFRQGRSFNDNINLRTRLQKSIHI